MDRAGFTNIEIQEFTYVWTINNFNVCLQSLLHFNETLISPTFITVGKNYKLEWDLKLRTQTTSITNYLFLRLGLISSDTPPIRAKYTFSIINNTGLKINESTARVLIERYTPEISFINLPNYNINNDLLSNGNLKICCKISIFGDITNSKIEVPECRIIDDYNMIFETKKFSDAILKVADGREIAVHKTILAARSPVFAAMFEHEMEERKLNAVNITDIDYETLNEMLKFIYTGKVENLEVMASELLVAADKYALERLKILCERELCTNLSIENAIELLKLANLHGADQLKSQAIRFINANPEIMDTVGWKQLKQETSACLFADIYEELVTSKISLIELPSE